MVWLRVARWGALVLMLNAMVGCAMLAPGYSPDYEALDKLKAAKPDKVQVGAVQPVDANAPLNRITLRGSPLTSPDGTFSKYLELALVRDLKEIGAYDLGASTKIDARLLQNDIDVSGFSTGTGVLEVELSVSRVGAQRLKKSYKAQLSFDSSFLGAVAIPAGQTQYSNLVRTLTRMVYTDPEFIKAIQP